MPLLKRKEWTLNPSPIDLKASDEVFIVRFTGEVFCDYDSYLTAMHKYMSKQWQCKFTGKSNLTYLEAVEEERKSAELLKEFPMEIEESCIRSVHHSIYKLEDLITFILEKQKPGKENEVASETTGIKRPTLTKRVLKRWIQEVATCTEGLWTVSPHHIQKYHLEISPSEEVQCRLHELRQKAVRTPRGAGHAGGSPGSNDAPTSPASPALEPPASKKSGQEKLQVLLSLQDEEKKLRPNSAKYAAFYVLKSVGVSGATAEDIIRLSTERGLKQDWSSNGLSTLKGVLRSEITFAKVCGGPKIMYALRAMPGVVPLPEAEPKPPKGSLNLTATQGHPLPGSNPSISSVAGLQPSSALATLNAGDTRAEALSSEAAPDLVDPMAKAERTMMQCRQAVERHRETVEAKEKLHVEMKAKVAAEVAALKSPSRAAGTPSSPVAVAGSVLPGSTASPSAASPSFELPSEFKSYNGPSDDRKGFLAWKKSRADMLEVLERRKEEYQLEQRRLRVKNSAGKREAEQQLQTVALQLEQAKKGLAASVLACRDAEKAVERERQRKYVREGKEREKIERDRERERIRQEMEKRRNDPLLSRKFPVDDLELLFLKRDKALAEGLSLPAPDVKLPSEPECALSTKEGRILADLMMSADFLQQFSKQLGLPLKSQLGHGELAASITALISEGKAGCNAPTPQLTLLPTVFQKLLSALIKERHVAKEAGRQEARWEAVLSESTWLEVLRRFLLSSDNSKDMIQLVVEVGKCELEDIPRETYAQLLRLLVDEAMSCESVREVLASRMEEATEVVTTMRSDIAEDKKRIREIEEEVREVKKKKREEELAASQAKVAKMSGSGSEGTGDKKILNAAATSSNAEEEPSFELPEHLKSWKGDAQDRKGMLEWRQQQQKARAKLDQEKARWEAERRAREKAKEAEMKAEAEEERKREKERRSLEESIQSKQEALEKALERLALRRSPLGSDRHGRQYWWSVGGYCSGLLVLESQEDQWKLLDQEDQIKMLMDSLDLQGIRECELHKALTHAMPALLSVVKRVTAGPPQPDGGKAAGEREVAGDEAAGSGKGSGTGSSGSRMKEKAPKGLPPERVQPSRRGKPVDLTEGSAAAAAAAAAAKIPAAATGAGKKRGRGEAQEEEKEEMIQADLLGPAQQGLKYQSLQHAFQHLCKLAGMAAAAKAPGPTGGWRSWRSKVQKQQEGGIDQAWAAGIVVEEERYGGMEQLRSDDATAAAVSEEKLQFRKDLLLCGARLLELEELLCEVTGDTEVQAKLMEKEETAGGKEGADGSDENGEGDKVVGEDEEVVMQEEEGEGQDKAAANEVIAQGSRHYHHDRPGMAAAAQSMGVVVADVEEGVDSDSDEPEVGHSKTLPLVWRSRVERSSWRACVRAAVTAPRMAYCAAVLTFVSEGPLKAYTSRNKVNRKK
ncbi:hypothetical protein CEUSTIGMA_g11478.t1 [Chlamydomonas eustigma]|uniref:WAC domain-containing protein n=1 Tax=Chlamydomonas eustigma TaxID=1157962 RepID=A0A250XLV4_9CHLO|nr:hypothetical protein CEUSTIGMA_g11478.t1 [Chlamydomonas eustigma]|eukprot:GAX84054.1 hypothetical protein CEUSTIGMA_g11478.t1 [Chlamydomonas eustigma]